MRDRPPLAPVTSINTRSIHAITCARATPPFYYAFQKDCLESNAQGQTVAGFPTGAADTARS
jgi:hypothetical protein